MHFEELDYILFLRPLLFCDKELEKKRPQLKKMRFSVRNGLFSMFIALSDTFCVKIVL